MFLGLRVKMEVTAAHTSDGSELVGPTSRAVLWNQCGLLGSTSSTQVPQKPASSPAAVPGAVRADVWQRCVSAGPL